MERDTIEWKGVEYPIATILIDGEPETLADWDLFAAIEEEYEKGNRDAVEIDETIYFYCDSGFIASNPSEKEIISHLDEWMR